MPLLARDPSFRLNFVASAVICAGFLVIVVVWLKETRPAGVQAGSVVASFRGYGERAARPA